MNFHMHGFCNHPTKWNIWKWIWHIAASNICILLNLRSLMIWHLTRVGSNETHLNRIRLDSVTIKNWAEPGTVLSERWHQCYIGTSTTHTSLSASACQKILMDGFTSTNGNDSDDLLKSPMLAIVSLTSIHYLHLRRHSKCLSDTHELNVCGVHVCFLKPLDGFIVGG